MWIVVSRLRDFLTIRFHRDDQGNTYVFRDLEVSGWIPNRLTEEADDRSQGFYPPWPLRQKGRLITPDIGREHDRLEKLTTLFFVWESLGDGSVLLPRHQLTNEVDMSFAYYIYKIRDLANDNKIDVPILELWLDSLDPEAGDAGSKDPDTSRGAEKAEPDGSNKKIKPTGATVEMIRLFESGKSIDDVVAATGTSAPNARQVESRFKRGLYEI